MTGGGETITFSWNSVGQLESATSSVHGTVQYQYDALGRRVSMAMPRARPTSCWTAPPSSPT